MKRGVVGAMALLALCSCSNRGDSTWMPLAKGSEWKYQVQNGMQNSVDALRVESQELVDGENGWRLSGPGGPSRLVWRDGGLYASQLAGTRFSPSILLMADSKDPQFKFEWKGDVMVAHRALQATSVTTMEEDSVNLSGKDVKARKSNVVIKLGKSEITVQTWFAKGVGIVRQEERSGDLLLRSMEYISGP